MHIDKKHLHSNTILLLDLSCAILILCHHRHRSHLNPVVHFQPPTIRDSIPFHREPKKGGKHLSSRWQNFMNKLLRLTFHFKSFSLILFGLPCVSYNCLALRILPTSHALVNQVKNACIENFVLRTTYTHDVDKKLILKYRLSLSVVILCLVDETSDIHLDIPRKIKSTRQINNKHVQSSN